MRVPLISLIQESESRLLELWRHAKPRAQSPFFSYDSNTLGVDSMGRNALSRSKRVVSRFRNTATCWLE
jgi:hypothetical protein